MPMPSILSRSSSKGGSGSGHGGSSSGSSRLPKIGAPGKMTHLGSNDLTKLLDAEQWDTAAQRCQQCPSEAGAWSSRPGFFEGIKTSDVLPIHIACSNRCTPELIDALHDANPDGLRAKESAYQRLPLHIACRSDASTDVINRLIQYFPEAAGIEDALGRLPLHYRLSNGADVAAVEALLNACPGGARAFDRRGWLPLHVATSVGANLDVVTKLVEAYPASVLLATNKGSIPRRCLKMAAQSPHKEEVERYLLKVEAEEQARLNRTVATPDRQPSDLLIV